MTDVRTLKQNLISEIFVVATGFAALIHSTWAISTLFSGDEPNAITNFSGYFSWMFVGLLVAFALDIGQIVTSHEIREARARGLNPKVKYVTFGVFALATYYLQWLYMIHHVPMLSLGAGVSPVHVTLATTLRDLSVWIVPAFLPLSTLLYTMSGIRKIEPEIKVTREPEIIEVQPLPLQLPERSGVKRSEVRAYVRSYLEEHPEARPEAAASFLGVGVSTVYRVRSEIDHENP